MTKDQLLDAMAGKADMSKAEAGRALDALTGALTDVMKSGDSVTLTGFGTFGISNRAARQGRNPQTGAALQIPAMRVPKFKAGKGLKDAVR